MAKYEMLVSRNVDQWATITIEASSHDEAREIADECGYDSVLPDGTKIRWESDVFDTEVTIKKINDEEVDESYLDDEEEDQ